MAGQESPQQTVDSSSPRGEQSTVRRFEGHLVQRIASGFIVLVPLLATVLILNLTFGYIDGVFEPILLHFGLAFPGVGVAISLILFYVIGAFFAGARFQALQDAILTRIPVVNLIYGVAREATSALSSPMEQQYGRVVFVEWPRPRVRAMAFVTGQLGQPDNGHEPLVAVYIPTVPNPTSGMLAFVHREDIIESNISIQDAMKTVFSGGTVLPDDQSLDLNACKSCFDAASESTD